MVTRSICIHVGNGCQELTSTRQKRLEAEKWWESCSEPCKKEAHWRWRIENMFASENGYLLSELKWPRRKRMWRGKKKKDFLRKYVRLNQKGKKHSWKTFKVKFCCFKKNEYIGGNRRKRKNFGFLASLKCYLCLEEYWHRGSNPDTKEVSSGLYLGWSQALLASPFYYYHPFF